jgi:SAM-dependent methyltransferase
MNTTHETLTQCILCKSPDIKEYDAQAQIWKCESCKLLFDNPRPVLAVIADYYSAKGKFNPWFERETPLIKYRYDLLNRLLSLRPSGNLLEIGAGTGHFLSYARKHYAYTGTEISHEGIAVAKERYNVDILHGEVESINFGDKKFDLIVMFHVLEHLPWPGRTLEFCKTLLKDDGLLYIAVPNEAPYSLRVLLPGLLSRLGIQKFKKFSYRGFRRIDMDLEEIHLSHFSEKTLRRFFVSAGYSIAKSGIDFIDPYCFSKGLIQIPRHLLYFASRLLYAVTGINTYNSLWIVAKKN